MLGLVRSAGFGALFLSATAGSALAGGPTIDFVSVVVIHDSENNVTTSSTPYGLDLFVEAEGLNSVSVMLPSGQTVNLTEDPGDPGIWEANVEDLAALPIGDYEFTFGVSGPDPDEMATVTYAPPPTTGFADVLDPFPDAADIEMLPEFEWLPADSFGSMLEVSILDAVEEEDLESEIIAVTDTTWEPMMALVPQTAYFFQTYVFNSVFTLEFTDQGTPFTFLAEAGHSNTVSFQVCAGMPSLGVSVFAPVDVGTGVSNELLGSISVTTNPSCGPGSYSILGQFNMNATGALIDNCYDFRWINIVTEYVLDGVRQTTDPVVGFVPAIDPVFKTGDDCAKDEAPFYFSNNAWNGACVGTPVHAEGLFSLFRDCPDDRGDPSLIEFETWLVAADRTSGTLGPQQVQALAGYRWVFDNNTKQNTLCTGLSASAARINQALATSQAPGNPANPGFPGWTALAGQALNACFSLSASSTTVDATAGGAQVLELNAGEAYANSLYFLVGSATGTSPGLVLNGNLLPLNLDAYTLLSIQIPNLPPFLNTLSLLDADGHSTAAFSLPPGDGSLAGIQLNHAYAILGLAPIEVVFTSSAVPLLLQ